MPIQSTVAALVSGRKTGVTTSNYVAALQKSDPQQYETLRSMENAINDLYRAVTSTTVIESPIVIEDPTGNVVAQFGDFYVNNAYYDGAAFANVWIGPGADPTKAPFFSNGSNVIIGQNGIVEVKDAGGNVVATLGVTTEAPQTITATSNASPDVITIASHGYVNGDTVLIAGSTGDTAPNGYRIVENVTTNTFTLTDLSGSPINGNGSYGGGGTATRYYAGILAETFAIGSTFANYKLRAFADGSLKITNATISLNNGSNTITISPTTPSITLSNGTNSIVLDSSVPEINMVGPSFTLTIDPTDGLEIVAGTVTLNVDGTNDLKVSDSSVSAYTQLRATGVTNAQTNNSCFASIGTSGPINSLGVLALQDHAGNELLIQSASASTATAGAGTLPAKPVGFITGSWQGSVIKIPYYAN